MSEPIIEQIAAWIENALEGVQDPDSTITLRSVRPVILNWADLELIHGDVIIEQASGNTESRRTTSSRTEQEIFRLNGIVTDLPADTAADTMLNRVRETIRRTMLAANANGQAMGGLAKNVDCSEYSYEPIDGGVAVVVTCEVMYMTALLDGYSAPG